MAKINDLFCDPADANLGLGIQMEEMCTYNDGTTDDGIDEDSIDEDGTDDGDTDDSDPDDGEIHDDGIHEDDANEDGMKRIIIRPECIYKGPWRYYTIGLVRQEVLVNEDNAEKMRTVPEIYHHVQKYKILLWKVGGDTVQPGAFEVPLWQLRGVSIFEPDNGTPVKGSAFTTGIDVETQDDKDSADQSIRTLRTAFVKRLLEGTVQQQENTGGRLLYCFNDFIPKQPILTKFPQPCITIAISFVCHLEENTTKKLEFFDNEEVTIEEKDDAYATIVEDVVGMLEGGCRDDSPLRKRTRSWRDLGSSAVDSPSNARIAVPIWRWKEHLRFLGSSSSPEAGCEVVHGSACCSSDERRDVQQAIRGVARPVKSKRKGVAKK